LQRTGLKAAPDDNAADVVEPDNDEWVAAILDCKGVWFRIETPPSTKYDGLKPKLPSAGPRGAVRGWSRRSCTNQRTIRDFGFDREMGTSMRAAGGTSRRSRLFVRMAISERH